MVNIKRQLLIILLGLTYSVGDEAAAKSIFFSTSNGPAYVARVSEAGSDFKTLISLPGTGRSVAVDNAHRKLYHYYENFLAGRRELRRSNLDGSNIEVVINDDMVDFELDVAGGKIYYARGSSMNRANLDGTQPEVLYEPPTAHAYLAVALDLEAGHIYLGDGYGDNIVRTNLDGSNPVTVIQFQEITNIHDIDVDPKDGKLYFALRYTSSPQTRTQRSNLDGSNIQDVISDDAGRQLALDLDARKIYWGTPFPGSSGPGLYRANLDGSSRELILPSNQDIYGIDLGVPEPSTLALAVVAGLAMLGRQRHSAAVDCPCV